MPTFLVTEQTILTRTIEVEAPEASLAEAAAVRMPASTWKQAPMQRPDVVVKQVEDVIGVGTLVYIGRGQVSYQVIADNHDGTMQIRSTNAMNVSLTKDVPIERLRVKGWWEK